MDETSVIICQDTSPIDLSLPPGNSPLDLLLWDSSIFKEDTADQFLLKIEILNFCDQNYGHDGQDLNYTSNLGQNLEKREPGSLLSLNLLIFQEIYCKITRCIAVGRVSDRIFEIKVLYLHIEVIKGFRTPKPCPRIF
jgi:hypothetical protein